MRIAAGIFLFVFLFLQSCKEKTKAYYHYPEDSLVCDHTGKLKDSLHFYFPSSVTRNGKRTEINIDTFQLNCYSTNLFCFHEPILYNYYTGHDIYRFLYLRSFGRPVLISLNKNEETVWLNLKELDKHPEFFPRNYASFRDDFSGGTKQTSLVIDSVHQPDRRAGIIRNDSVPLSMHEWNEFASLLDSCSFWSTAPYQESSGIDGSEWLIEAHLENDYWFVNRWSPNDGIRRLGMYLLKKSGLQEDIY